ncbi:MAG: VTT domain-containing protein [Bacteroidales bacterium]
MALSDKTKFLLKHALQGVLWMIIMFSFVYMALKWMPIDLPPWLDSHANQHAYIYGIYILSEVLFGIIPPELFMIWATSFGRVGVYIANVALLATISYLAGYLAFLGGRYLNKVVLYRYIRKKFFAKHWPLVHKYGAFLIVVAALTPLPFSGTSLLIGATGCPQSTYLLYALTRFIRFSVYGLIVYQAF